MIAYHHYHTNENKQCRQYSFQYVCINVQISCMFLSTVIVIVLGLDVLSGIKY